MIRTIRTKKYRYIRNFLPHQPYASFYPVGGFFAPVPQKSSSERAFWETSCLPSKEKVHNPDGVFLMLGPPTVVRENGLPEAYLNYLIWQDHKPLEELYDTENDPEQIHNLADDPAFEEIRGQLREKLYSWMIETRDLNLLDKTEIVARAADHGGISRTVGVHCDNFERLLETADLARLVTKGKNELLNRLSDSDSGVRFWAVVGLSSFELDAALVAHLEPLLTDASISVSLAAADYLVRLGEGAQTLKAFTKALEGDILWAHIRAGAYLSYCNREQLRPMQPLIPILQSAMQNRRIFGPEQDYHIRTHLTRMLDAQRDVIGREWVLHRVVERIRWASDQRA